MSEQRDPKVWHQQMRLTRREIVAARAVGDYGNISWNESLLKDLLEMYEKRFGHAPDEEHYK